MGICKNIFMHEQYLISVSFNISNAISLPQMQLQVMLNDCCHFVKCWMESDSVLLNKVFKRGLKNSNLLNKSWSLKTVMLSFRHPYNLFVWCCMNHAKYSFQRFLNASLNLQAKGLFPRDLAFTFSRNASKSSTSSSVLKQSTKFKVRWHRGYLLHGHMEVKTRGIEW